MALARAPHRTEWSAGGLLSQIALRSGNTETDLEEWDRIDNRDGPLTLDRIQGSGNGFAGWPLDVLVALDEAWRGGADRSALERLAGRSEPTEDGYSMAEPYGGPERRSEPAALPRSFSIQQAVGFGTLLALLSAGMGYVARVDLNVTANAASIAANTQKDEDRYRELRAIADDFQKTKLTYCLNSKADTSRRFPDAGC